MERIVLIPAYKPASRLTDLVFSLADKGMTVVVVDDGSGSEYQPVFSRIEPRAKVITCEENGGKGTALKIGLAYINGKYSLPYTVTTADADGQHCVEDIIRVSEEAVRNPDAMVIGCRDFGRDMPLRNWFGNIYTKAAFLFATGKFLQDTQTGLRGFSDKLVPFLLGVRGKRYEYEINVLLWRARCDCRFVEVPITTIYNDGNSGSHFHAIRDSLCVYREIIRFSAPAFIGFVLDVILFAALFIAGVPFAAANAAARLVSAPVNFAALFMQTKSMVRERRLSAARYFSAAAVILALNTLLLWGAISLGMNAIGAKVLIDVVMYFLTFVFQRRILFKKEERAKCD